MREIIPHEILPCFSVAPKGARKTASNIKSDNLLEFFIYLLFRRKRGLYFISPSLPTPSPNESPAKRVSFGKGGTRSSVDVTAQARPHDLMALFGRNKRYNTLDLASKVVRQRRVSSALLWKPPGYRQHHVHRRGNTPTASICFHTSAKRGEACLCIKQARP